jgi:hypothetical protein
VLEQGFKTTTFHFNKIIEKRPVCNKQTGRFLFG